ncbi:MAG: glycosyltransferase, partial [Rhodobacteraceae bacterium]|nr:glycosyltransferase [Paracoccaceae bacterium]
DLAGGPVTYVNVGHSNLRAQVFAAVKSHEKSHIIVLIHDIIPLSYPEYSRPEATARFGADMVRVARLADGVIYNSAATRAEAEQTFAGFGRVPPGMVAHLGLDQDFISQDHRFAAASERPRFHIVGTIEPRKNHMLLLQIWREMLRELPASEVPELHIIGRRGWNNDNVFKILDADPMMGHQVFEHNSMTDAQLGRALASSWGLLFPSHAEGFGLPLIEAAARGIPILCGENTISREVLGDYPLYLNVDNSYAWRQGILGRAGRKRESEADRQTRGGTVSIPDWPSHFDRIFRFI